MPDAENAALIAWMETVSKVLGEVSEERVRQQIKWGEQNHPDGTGPLLSLEGIPRSGSDVFADDLETWARGRCQWAAEVGVCTYENILTEEWAEAIASESPRLLRCELIQVAAVACAWVEKVDRDLGTSPASEAGQ